MSDNLRPPCVEDAPAVARLLSEDSPEPVDAERIVRAWTTPGVKLEEDARLGPESYARIENLDGGRVWISLGGRPATALLDWAEIRARAKGSRLLSGGWATNELLREELERRGFRVVRHSHRMVIDLAEPTPAAVWPDGFDVRTFRSGDERLFYELHQETFRDAWEPIEESYEEWEHWQLRSPTFVSDLWFLALAHDEPAGLAICYPHPVDGELGFVGVLGVRRKWRRRGLGRALLLHAFSEFRVRDCRRAALGVDAESLTGANKLYEQAGMHVAARFDIYEKAVA